MKYIAIPLLLCLLLVLPAQARDGADLVETAVKAGSFQTLTAALGKAGLVDALKGPGPFTVFAPTDDAFADLPDGTVDALLRPENAKRLQSILTYHVVSGRVLSTDLLKTASAKTLNGEAVGLGLRVGEANVIQADIRCANGVIHVIDRVLIPPKPEKPRETTSPRDAKAVLSQAIERGVPLFNAGQVEACAAIYATAAEALMGWPADALPAVHRQALEAALKADAKDERDRAWILRRAFDRILDDRPAHRSSRSQAFRPIVEAPLPKGFPGPGPLEQVVVKQYPRYRAARAQGGNPFWTLFRHIKKHDVSMTAPVEMTMGEDLRMRDMAFLYEAPDQGRAGTDGKVAVLDLEPVEVLSIGMRGPRSADAIARATKALEKTLATDGWRRAGDLRVLGYNSPMIPASKRFWEVQIPIAR